MKVTLQVIIERDDEPPIVDEVACLERDALTPETLGLMLAEAKTILAQLHETLVPHQAAAYVAQQQTCPQCGRQRRCKGHDLIVLRTLFGTLTLSSPRLYTCRCQPADTPRSSSPLADCFSERTTPELRYLEAKWAALLPYGVTVDVLEEVLPLQANRATVYRHAQQVAEQLEGELGDEQPFFIEGCQRDWDALPRPDGPLTVGIDGGYVHARDGDKRKAGWFEVIVGKSVPTDGGAKCFGFVTGYDTKSKRRLAELLKVQGLQMNQAITFLSDGGDKVRDLQLYLSPLAEHLLDWFHLTMRITCARQEPVANQRHFGRLPRAMSQPLRCRSAATLRSACPHADSLAPLIVRAAAPITAPSEGRHLRQKVLHGTWFGDEAITAGRARPRFVGQATRGERKHGNMRRSGIRLQPPGGQQSVDHWQHQIHQDDIGPLLLGKDNGIGAIARAAHRMPRPS